MKYQTRLILLNLLNSAALAFETLKEQGNIEKFELTRGDRVSSTDDPFCRYFLAHLEL